MLAHCRPPLPFSILVQPRKPQWNGPPISCSCLQEGVLLSCLKETIIRPILNPNLVTGDLNNLKIVANIPFTDKLIERVVADQLQMFLEETDFLDPF